MIIFLGLLIITTGYKNKGQYIEVYVQLLIKRGKIPCCNDKSLIRYILRDLLDDFNEFIALACCTTSKTQAFMIDSQ